MYLKAAWDALATKKLQQEFYIQDTERGGWGKLTMGLLLPQYDGEKSYGIYGMEKSRV